MFELKLKPDEMRVVLAGLHELPIKLALPTLQVIQFQIRKQGEPEKPVEPEKKDKKKKGKGKKNG